MNLNHANARLRRLCGAALFILPAMGNVVGAQNLAATQYPIKPIKFVVPFAPGGPNDVMARIMGARLSTNLGQPVVIENKAGAGGVIGTETVAKAPADGYTLVFASGPFTMAPALQAKMPYDARKDFVAVTKIAESPMVMMVPSTSKFSDAKALVDFAKSNPEKVSYGSGGTGSTPHLTTELLTSVTGAKFLHVPYKGGGESIRALMAGEVDMLIDSITSTAGPLASGRIKPLAVTQSKRSLKLPTVPTFDESGIKKFEMTHWVGVLAPKGTPSEVVAYLRNELVKALKSPDVESKLIDLGAQPVGDASVEFQKFVNDEIGKWESVAKSRNIKAD